MLKTLFPNARSERRKIQAQNDRAATNPIDLRPSAFGLRSSAFGLRPSVFGLRSSVFSFYVPCLTVGAVPLLILPRNRESANVNFILSGVIKSVGLNFVPAVLRGNKKKKTVLPSQSTGTFFKRKNHLRIVQCVFLRFSTCCLHVYSRGFTTTTQWGDTILSLSESCLVKSRRKKRLKRLLISK